MKVARNAQRFDKKESSKSFRLQQIVYGSFVKDLVQVDGMETQSSFEVSDTIQRYCLSSKKYLCCVAASCRF